MLVIRVRGELLFDGVARTTRAKASERIAFSGFHLFGIEIARVGIATLDDETRHVAMKFQIIVEALLREFDEIANMDGCTFAIELDPDGSLRSLDKTWCPLQDSNLRLSAPEADALSPELRGHCALYYTIL